MDKTIKEISTALNEIREKRDELSETILEGISEFEESTGQGVKEIELSREHRTPPPNRTVKAKVKIARDDE